MIGLRRGIAPPPRGRVAGFTLVELLIALSILAVVTVLAWRGTSALADGEARLAAEAARWRTLDAGFARIEADLREAIPRESRRGAAREAAWLGLPDAEGNSVLRITRAGPEFSVEPGLAGQRLGYRLRERALEVLYWPELDNAESTAPAAFALVDDVAAFRLEYLGSGGWRTRWPAFGEPDLPRAVKATLVLASGETIERWFALR